jgi:hypothetical protein
MKSILTFVGLLAITCSQVQAADAAKIAPSQVVNDIAKQAVLSQVVDLVDIQAEAVQFDPLVASVGQFDVIGTPQVLEPVVKPQFVSPPGAPADAVVSLASFGTATPYRSGGAQGFGVTDAVASTAT